MKKIFLGLILSISAFAQAPQNVRNVAQVQWFNDNLGACTWIWNPNTQTISAPCLSGGAGITLQTNGTPNSSQSLLNLVPGTNVTITNTSGGNVQISASGGGTQTFPATPGITVYAGSSTWGTSLTAPSGTIVGTTDTQTLTNKTVDGVTPTTFGYLDATSSIQTQINSKAPLASPTFTGTVTCSGTCVGFGPTLQTNGSNNGSQVLQNLVAGANITLSNSGGMTTIAASGSTGVTSFSAPSGSWPSWLVPTVTNSTSTPSLTVAAGNIPVTALNGGTGATSSTFWRGDGTWATPSGGGSPGGSTNSVQYNNGGTFAGVSLASGQLVIGGSSVPTAQTVGGDATLNSSGSLIVTKTNGVAFGTMATSNLASPNTFGNTQTFNNIVISGTCSGSGCAGGTASAITVNTQNNIVNLALVSGVTTGTGQSTSTQTATCTALNNAIANAESSGQIIYVPEATYQIYCSSGLLLQSGSPVWRGTKSSCFVQFYNNAPVITIGQISGGGFNYYVDFDGGCFQYNSSQSGNTNSNTMVIGGIADSHVRNVLLGATQGSYTFPTTPYFAAGYRGLYMAPNSNHDSAFASWISDFHVQGAYQDLLGCGGFIEGVIFDRLYLLNGNNGYGGNSPQFGLEPGQLGGAAIDCTYGVGSGSGIQESEFRQINVEGVYANALVSLGQAESTIFEDMHFEGDFLSGSNPAIYFSQISNPIIIGGTYQNIVTRTDYMSGTAAFVKSYNDVGWIIDNPHYEIDCTASNCAGSTYNNVNWLLFNTTSGTPINQSRGFQMQDNAGVNTATMGLDNNLTPGNGYLMPVNFREYGPNEVQSFVDAPQIKVGATYSHWGNLRNSYLNVTAAVTVTLQDNQYGTTPGSSLPTATNTTVHVHNSSGGTVTIADATAGTITTITTGGGDKYFRFNGTAWVVFT